MKYPFYKHSKNNLKLPTNKSVKSLSLNALRQKEIQPDDLGIHADTLNAQADVSEEAGFHQLASNLKRSAELASIPDDHIMKVYEALRPGRSTPEELMDIAREMEEKYNAPLNAAFIREAAGAG